MKNYIELHEYLGNAKDFELPGVSFSFSFLFLNS